MVYKQVKQPEMEQTENKDLLVGVACIDPPRGAEIESRNLEVGYDDGQVVQFGDTVTYSCRLI